MTPTSRSRPLSCLLALVVLLPANGCGTRWGLVESVDPGLALQTGRALRQRPDEPPRLDEFREDERVREPGGSIGEAILGELIAIFPGILLHGAGHFYAGDRRTARKLNRIGQFGYLLTGVGAGLSTGGYYALEEDIDGLGYSLFGSGAAVGGMGIFYVLTAWGYDLYDTPRAVLSGGEPPPSSPFVDALDLFGE